MERGKREREKRKERERERNTHRHKLYECFQTAISLSGAQKNALLFCVCCFPDLCISWQDDFAKLIDEDDLHSRMTLSI